MMQTSQITPKTNTLRKNFLIGTLLLGLTGSQSGCGCECATVATVIGIATPVVWIARETREARKTELEIKRLEAAKEADDQWE